MALPPSSGVFERLFFAGTLRSLLVDRRFAFDDFVDEGGGEGGTGEALLRFGPPEELFRAPEEELRLEPFEAVVDFEAAVDVVLLAVVLSPLSFRPRFGPKADLFALIFAMGLFVAFGLRGVLCDLRGVFRADLPDIHTSEIRSPKMVLLRKFWLFSGLIQLTGPRAWRKN